MIFKILIIFFVLIIYSKNAQNQNLIRGKALVIDGDTIHINKKKIRLHGIDAPETKQTCDLKDEKWNCGQQSTNFLSKLINMKFLDCKVKDIDKYERYVAVCFVSNININQMMVRSGWAIAYRYYSMDYVNDENFARKNKLGIWRGKFIEPYLYRKRNN